MKNRRSVSGAEPYAPKQLKAITGGREGKDDTCDHGLYAQKLWKLKVCQKKKLTRRDDQSAISSKEHVKYEATQTYLSVTYQHERLHLTGNDHSNGVRDHSNNKAHRLYFSKESSRGKKTPNNAIPGRMHATTGFFRGYCLLTTTFAWRSSTAGGTCIKQPSRPRGRSHSQCCCVAFSGAVIVITTTSSSFSHARACHVYIHVCACTCIYRKSINKCTTMIPTAVP